MIAMVKKIGEQTKGACLVPKRALRVMEGEVNRIMQLTSNSVIPIMYQVPRKTYRDFHGDLYPETNGYRTDLTVTQWLKGVNTSVPKMSLDPKRRELGDAPIIVSPSNKYSSAHLFVAVVKSIRFSPYCIIFYFFYFIHQFIHQSIVITLILPIKISIKDSSRHFA